LGSKFLGGAKRGTARESSDDQSNLGFQIAFEVNRTPRSHLINVGAGFLRRQGG